ncbi:MAG: ParA family partition ATPase [Polyangiaceae bacterium]
MIIALAGQKGGVGKTTIAIGIATEWVDRGARVLLVDADPQGSSRTWADVASEQGHKVPTVVAMGANLHKKDQLPLLVPGYDHVIVDCPPAHGPIQRAALMVADVVLLPCSPSPVDVWALASSLELVEQAQAIRDDLLAAIVITRKDPRTAIGRQVRVALEAHGLPVIRAELGNRVAYPEALSVGSTATRFAPRGAAARETKRLVNEVEALAAVRREANVA